MSLAMKNLINNVHEAKIINRKYKESNFQYTWHTQKMHF